MVSPFPKSISSLGKNGRRVRLNVGCCYDLGLKLERRLPYKLIFSVKEDDVISYIKSRH